MLRILAALCALLGCWQSAFVAVAAEPGVLRLVMTPAELSLRGPRGRQQVLVSGLVSNDEKSLIATDLTRDVSFTSTKPDVATVTASGIVQAKSDGETEIIVKHGSLEARAKVVVTEMSVPTPIDFRTDVIAALSQPGCNSGPCHGSPQGKNGFRLSLRGFDPRLDYGTLGREASGRRTNIVDPEKSLILLKADGSVPHQGGIRLRKTDEAYHILRTWIAEGCRQTEKPRSLVRLEVLPSRRELLEAHRQQQLIAIAHFDDGTSRDVTHQAVFSSNDDASASVSTTGLVEFHRTAEVTFLVRYLSQVVGSRMTFVRRDPQFVYRAPPVANYVDEHVFAKQRALQITPAALTEDAVFLRRVYLDTIGTLPTPDEAKAFLDSTAADKRARVIDSLLGRDEFAYFWALKWADVMRGSDVTISRRGVHSFHRYLVERFRNDRPFDEFARETLTSQGNTLHQPGANFHRIAKVPEDAAEAMAQLFLGVRIGCARCHNHPFEAMTQGDFYGLAAYFARVKFKGQQFGKDDEIVYLDRRDELRHPVTREVVAPVAFGVKPEGLKPEDDRRPKLVEWLTSPTNPFFARSIVNRLWYHVVGRGIVDPVDDFRDTNPPANEELLNALAEQFRKEGFRLKPVLKVILNSSTYQLSAQAAAQQSPQAADPAKYFAQATTGMLGAEQVLDAVSAAIGIPTEFPGYPVGTRAIELADGTVEHHFLKAFSKPVRDASCECARESDPSLGQVIHLLNNPTLIANLQSNAGRVAQWLAAGKSDDEIIEQIYLTTLTRRPTASELALVKKHVKSVPDRRAGLCDVQFALLNSHEFLLRH